ncbi:unnamed protein product [Oikopleura dioica]|uniref:Profilin n=1 Tax=Oikopleura dioica TaxID=34765 RepID=E4YW79_OIKDI|nr:unnamed protein product [Oikopleura dioica]
MSWTGYITGEGGLLAQYNRIACAGIFGKNGSTYAQAGMDHVQTNYTEILSLAALFTDPASGFSAGFDFNGKSFALLRVEDKILHAKGKGEGAMYPMTVQMTQQAMVIAIGHHDAFAGSVSAAVGKIADYLEDNGF